MNNESAILSLFALIIGKIKGLFEGSLTHRALRAVAGLFRRMWNKSLMRSLLAAENPGVGNALDHSVMGKLAGAVEKLSRSKAPEGSLGFFPDSIGRILGDIPHTSSRSFALACVAFMAAALPFTPAGLWRNILYGIFFLGVLLFFINRSFHNLFGSSVAVRFVGELFGFEGEGGHRPEVNHPLFYGTLGIGLGALFGLLDLSVFIMAAGAAVGGILVMYRTEIGVFAAALLIPIVPTVIILGICAVTVFSYFTKIIIVRRGSLPFKLGPLEALAFLFALSLAYSILISYRPAGSFIVAATYILYILFFFAAKNTLRTRKMVFGAVSLLVLSGLVVSAYGVYQQITGNFVETAAWIDDEMFVQATARIYSTLDNPNVLGKYLIFAMSITFAMLYYMKKPLHKLGILGVLGVAALCMIFTQSRGAWLGLIFAVAAFALIHDRRLLLLGILALIAMPVFMPDTVIDRFLSIGDLTDSSTNYRVNIWLASLLMIRTVWPSGIGPGEPSFRHVYQEYAFHAVEAPHSHNLFLQVIIDQGIFGLLLLLLLILAFFKRLFAAYRRSKDPFIRAASAALAAGMTGFLIQGLTDHVWYNYRVVAYFWLILAMAGALYGLNDRKAKEITADE